MFCVNKVKDGDSNENFKQFSANIKKLMESSASLKSDSFEDALHQMAANTVKEHEAKEIEEQAKVKHQMILSTQSFH